MPRLTMIRYLYYVQVDEDPYLEVHINDDSLPVVQIDEDSLPGCPD